MTPGTTLRILAGLPLGEAVDERSPVIRVPGDVPIRLVGSSGNPGWSYDTHLIGTLDEEPSWPMIALSPLTGILFVCI